MSEDIRLGRSGDAGRRKRRPGAIVLGAIVAALAVNTVLASRDTAAATGERQVRLRDGDLHVVDDGPPDAPALLLIHGNASSTAWWDPVVPALAARYRVIRVDLLGHGQSAKPIARYDVPAQGRRSAELLDELGVANATIIAHSMGGMVATALAERRPDLVTALALIDSAPSPGAPIRQPLIPRLVPVPVLGQLLWRLRADEQIRAGLATAFTRDIDLPAAVIDGVRGMTYRSFTKSPKEAGRFIAARTLPDRLAVLDRPVLVIFGSEDRRVRSAAAQEYQIVPDARIEMVPGVGHTPMLEDPQRTIDLLLDFLARHNAAPTRRD
ncbi:alpha/beta fold hydrolase [Nocardia sp. NPDC051052]|uniref:alpha/beta fold hydrolase n=1 Tax=Nocardia sp. NPDC051052 TaxID=3364322 RepID=UPI00378FA392